MEVSHPLKEFGLELKEFFGTYVKNILFLNARTLIFAPPKRIFVERKLIELRYLKIFLFSYLYIYPCFRFVFSLFGLNIVCRKSASKYVVQYFFFFQIFTFVRFIILSLVISGDVKVKPLGLKLHANKIFLCVIGI